MLETAQVATLQVARRHAWSLLFTPSGKTLVTGGMEGALKEWNVGKWTLKREFKAHTRSVNALSLDQEARTLASGGSESRVHLWAYGSGTVIATLKGYDSGWLSPNGRYVVLRKPKRELLFVYDRHKEDVTSNVSTDLTVVGSVAFHPGGDRFAVCGNGPEVTVWGLPTGDRLSRMAGHGTAVTGVAFTDSGQRLATADYEGTVRVWDLGREDLESEFSGGEGGYFFVAAHPSKKILATAGSSNVSLWSFDGTQLAKVPLGIKGVYNVAFDPTGTWLANAGADGKVRVWRVADLLGSLED